MPFKPVIYLFFVYALIYISCKQHPTGSGQASAPDNVNGVNMVKIPGGTFNMGTNDPAFPDAKPVHQVTVNAFLMDEHEVTNAQFEQFVNATHYVTVAEQKPRSEDYPGVPEENLIAGSAVFTPPPQEVELGNPGNWWTYIAGANWRHPKGPGSSIAGHGNDPVVQVCYTDAVAYAKWAGKRLPTEAEWEFAAKGGLGNHVYYWGDEFKPKGKFAANIYEGNFPWHNTVVDGFEGVSPVKSYAANPYGLYDMEGNVWEWCSDYYRPDYYAKSPIKNPQGPADSYNPDEPNTVARVQRGGSFLCSDDYCLRYKAGSRGKGEYRSASNNLGFRCVRDVVSK